MCLYGTRTESKQAMFKNRKILIFVLPILIVVLMHCDPGEVNKPIGGFRSRDAAITESIRSLSREIRFYPWKDTFRIYWSVEMGHPSPSHWATLYERMSKTIGYEADPDSGYSKWWSNIDDEAIHGVARKKGTFEDFEIQ